MHIYLDRVRIQFIRTQKINKAKGRGTEKNYQVTNGKESDAPVTFTKCVNMKYWTDITS